MEIVSAGEKCGCCTQQQILDHSLPVDVFSLVRHHGLILQVADAPKRNWRRREAQL